MPKLLFLSPIVADQLWTWNILSLLEHHSVISPLLVIPWQTFTPKGVLVFIVLVRWQWLQVHQFGGAIIRCFIDMPPNYDIPFEGFDFSYDFFPEMDFGEDFCFGGDFSFLPELDVDFFDGFSKSVSHRSQSCYAAARVALVCLWHRFPASLPTCIPPFLSHFIFGTLATKFLKTCRATHLWVHNRVLRGQWYPFTYARPRTRRQNVLFFSIC